MKIELEEADRIIIETVERACQVGIGRTFTTTAGQTVRVVSIDERWVEMEVMRQGLVDGETLALPRNARRIAWALAKMKAISRPIV